MSLSVEALACALVPSLVERVGSSRHVVFCAPPEFLPVELAAAVMRALEGPDHVAVNAGQPGGAEAARHALAQGRHLLLRCPVVERGASPPVVLEALEGSRGNQRLIVVMETDAPEQLELCGPDKVLLCAAELLVPSEALIHLVPAAATDPQILHRLVHRTGCVPGLVIALAGSASSSAAREVARGWASRLFDAIEADPLDALQMWLGRVPEDVVVALATRVLRRPVASDEVRVVRSRAHVTSPPQHVPGPPDLLARAVQRLFMVRDEEGTASLRQSLIEAVVESDDVPGTQRIQVLTSLEAWPAIDGVLRTKLHLLATLTSEQRHAYSRVWPDPVPAGLQHLAAGRRFVTEGAVRYEALLPAPWRALLALLVEERHEDSAVLPAQVLSFLRLARTRVRPKRVAPLRGDVRGGSAFLSEAARRAMETQDATMRDDAALTAATLLGHVEACLAVGLVVHAQQAVSQALALCDARALDADSYPRLRPAALARAALLAAKSGMPDVAARRERDYEAAVAATGVRDGDDEKIMALFRRFHTGYPARPVDGGLLTIDPSMDFAPLAAEAEALRALLLHGPEGREWGRGMADRAAWSVHPVWEWWPLHSVLALFEAREGRVDEARAWMEIGSLPETQLLLTRASVALAEGDDGEALALAEAVLGMPEIRQRWRLVAAGIRVSAKARSEDVSPDVLLSLVPDWGMVLGAVVLLPDHARALVVEALGPEFQAMPGLNVPPRSRPLESVKLTPRQLEVLRLLEGDRTLGQIAEQLYVSPETVRTTAKMLYKRLGVHDRASAVRLGYVHGLLQGGPPQHPEAQPSPARPRTMSPDEAMRRFPRCNPRRLG